MNEGDSKAWEHGIATMEDFVSDEEKQRLADMFSQGKPKVTDAEIEKLIDWARTTRIAHALLESIIKGQSEVVRMRRGEAVVRLTAKGTSAAERVARRMGLPVDD